LGLSSTLPEGQGIFEPLSSLPNLTQLALDVDPGNHFDAESLRPLARIPLLRHLHLRALLATPGMLFGLVRTMCDSANVRTQLHTLALCYADLAPWTRARSAQGESIRQRSMESLRGLRSLSLLVTLELSFVRPLAAVLPQVAHMPVLEHLLLGDDDLAAIEEEPLQARSAAVASAPPYASSSSASARPAAPAVPYVDLDDLEGVPGGLMLSLQRAPSLHTIALYGFTGVLDRRSRMESLAARAALSRVNGVSDIHTGLLPPARSRCLVDVGERRDVALRRMPIFGFDPLL
jgi:hypothetical protein